jgi:hypothetical protein
MCYILVKIAILILCSHKACVSWECATHVPTLLSAGRINKQVYMGNLAAAEALAMVKHYFEHISNKQQQLLLDSWIDGVVSPAALEALCAEHEEVDKLLAATQQLLAGLAGSSKHSSGSQKQQQQQQQQVKATAAAAASASACCEGSFSGRPGSSCFIIRASSCAASFMA